MFKANYKPNSAADISGGENYSGDKRARNIQTAEERRAGHGRYIWSAYGRNRM